MGNVTLHIFKVRNGPGRAVWHWICDQSGKHLLRIRTVSREKAVSAWKEKFPGVEVKNTIFTRGYRLSTDAEAYLASLRHVDVTS